MEPRSVDPVTRAPRRGEHSSESATDLASRVLDATRVALLWGVTFAVAASGALLVGRMVP